MRNLKILLTLSSFVIYSTINVAMASEDLSCDKKSNDSHIIHCKAKKVMNVSLVSINGGECNAPSFRWSGSGGFSIPGTKECYYVRSVTLSIDGRTKTFGPL